MSVGLNILTGWLRTGIEHLILHVTDRCNLRCRHCFVDLTERHTLSPEKAAEIADDVGRILWLDVGGGEPYLLENIAELIAPFDCSVLGIPTNGHFPEEFTERTREVLAATSAEEVVVSVSIEGFAEEHLAIRHNKHSYERAFETLRLLRALANQRTKGPSLKIKCNTVITNKNADRLIEFMQHVKSTGLVDFHSIIMLRGDPYKPEIELPYLETLKQLRPKIFEILNSYLWGSGMLKRGFLRKYYRFLWDISLESIEHGTQAIPCTGGQRHLVIWANGDVAPCELLPPVGNIYKDRLTDILQADDLRKSVRSIRNNECSCTHNCAMLDSILLNPRVYPRLLVG